MYITSGGNSVGVANTVVAEPCPICPAPCEASWTGQINLLGILLALISVAIYIVQKKYFSHIFRRRKRLIAKILKWSFWVTLSLAILYVFSVQYHALGDVCQIKGLVLSIGFWPTSIFPF